MDYVFEKGKLTEAELEKAIIELCTLQGYTYVCGDDMHRKYEDILLLDDLRSYLTSRYIGLSDTEMQKIIKKLSLINATPLYLGNREAFRLVNEGFDLARDDISQVALHIDYINYDEPDKNIFKVINQYSVQGEPHIKSVGLLLPLASQVLAFIIGKLALVLVGKALVKVGSDLLIKCVVDSTLVGHTLELHSLALGRSATLLFLGFHSGVSFVFISA